MFGKKKDENDVELTWGTSKTFISEDWPKDETGETEQAVPLISLPEINQEADMKMNMLSAYGIPSFKKYNNAGDIGKIFNGFSGYGATLYVPISQLEDAKALLADNIDIGDDPENQE